MLKRGHELDNVLRYLTSVGVKSLISQPPTLEDVFLQHYASKPGVEDGGPDRLLTAAPR